MNVQLTWTEVRIAALMGIERAVKAMARGGKRLPEQSDDKMWSDTIIGSLGELAVAKSLGLYVVLADDRCFDGDVGRLEVRATTRRSGSLIIRLGDADDRIFVLVCGVPPTLYIAGWLPAGAAKQPAYWRTDVQGRSPAWFVPQEDLRPIELLRHA